MVEPAHPGRAPDPKNLGASAVHGTLGTGTGVKIILLYEIYQWTPVKKRCTIARNGVGCPKSHRPAAFGLRYVGVVLTVR